MPQTVRVIRTWDVTVEAEYGDTDEILLSKITEEFLDETPPDSEVRIHLEAHDSPEDKNPWKHVKAFFASEEK